MIMKKIEIQTLNKTEIKSCNQLQVTSMMFRKEKI